MNARTVFSLRLLAGMVVLLAAVLHPAVGRAHHTSVVSVDMSVHGRVVNMEVRIDAQDLGEPLGISPLWVPTREQVRRRVERAVRYVTDRIAVTNGGVRCPVTPVATSIRDRDRSFVLAIALQYICGRTIDDLGVRYELFFSLDPRHQGHARIRAFGTDHQYVFRDGDRQVRLRGEPSRLALFRDYFLLGVEHIFTGYDHLAFLFSLLVIAAARPWRDGWRSAFGVVTAFTVAHSVTLAAAALGWVRLPSRWVESAIALSILYVAVQNAYRAHPRGRWMLTFVFGLVHGFGFASVLGELGLPASGRVFSLLAFNVGVEAGQILLVLLAFPVLQYIRRARWRVGDVFVVTLLVLGLYVLLARFDLPRGMLATVVFGTTAALAVAARQWGYDRAVRVGGSVVISALAALWLSERLANRQWFGGILG